MAAELRSAHGIVADVAGVDLGQADGANRLFEEVRARGREINYLVNNAGFGGHGFFHEQDLTRNLAMVDLNIKALMMLTSLFLPEMIERGSGRILNVGSTAGMIPGPLQATYHASKAFVNSFSQALANELEDKGITVTVLAPGPVATEFFDRANMLGVSGIKDNMASAHSVARFGYDAMMSGNLVAINDPKLRFLLRWVTPFLSRSRVLSMARRFSEKEAE
ncbi:SDR family NAD(P)-dependent oxidoreductase [Oricola cellulosilytica]|uniref:SDR family NAD(P)-dependent oxidoreductase n=1 Tax=Oricola cellulosilytica TaxID=1429082 RepID=UPI001FCE45AE|nr:SDR family NAD(P)-dependent oxidoreductase [Oricola cellulosilytica]